MNHRNRMSCSAAAGVVALLVSLGSPAWAEGEQSGDEAVDLLIAAEPTFAENLAPATAASTELQGVEATVSGNTITLESADGGISVEAPAASASSSVTPVLLEDAEALFAIQLDATDAPTEYDFTVELPENGSFELLDNGGIIFTNGAGGYVGGVAPPWAKPHQLGGFDSVGDVAPSITVVI